MEKLTKYQIEEIIPLIEIRRETVEEDEDSADELEATPGALDELEAKIESNSMNFTELEKQWLIGELETRMNIANGNKGHGEDMHILAFNKSMQNAIDKINAC